MVDYREVKLFLNASDDQNKVTATLKALIALISQADPAVLTDLEQIDMFEQIVIDSLLRFKGSIMRSATFELLATIAAFK